ncbi:MAG: hypothetical protein ACYCW6_31830 [Candidatus Xenobia bacterium]
MLGRTLEDFQQSEFFSTLALGQRMRTPTPNGGAVTTFQPRTRLRSEVTLSIREDGKGRILSLMLGLSEGVLQRQLEADHITRGFLSLLPKSEVPPAAQLLQRIEDGQVPAWDGSAAQAMEPFHRTALTLENLTSSGRILLLEVKPACHVCHKTCELEETCPGCGMELPAFGEDRAEPLLKAAPTTMMREPEPKPLLRAAPTTMMSAEPLLPDEPAPANNPGPILQAVQTRMLGAPPPPPETALSTQPIPKTSITPPETPPPPPPRRNRLIDFLAALLRGFRR